MILTDAQTTLSKIGIGETTAFKIKTSSKSFKILSKGIYTDEIRAPIRELATNAWDSHVAAKNIAIPFEVHLPSMLEPYFYVQDFGVGMDETEVETIYTTYFESTKVESNDYVGCLGLGSKSPFCYTDAFTIESIKDGVKCHYMAFEDNGSPTLTKLKRENTNERSGMKISFAVKTADIPKFIEHAHDIYSVFQHKPKILNCSDLKLEHAEYAIVGKDYKFGSKALVGLRVVMGNIAYPVPETNLPILSRTFIKSYGAEITMPIGSVEISTNRESLYFDDRTKRNLTSRVVTLTKDILTKLQQKIDSFETYYDMISFVDDYSVFKLNVPRQHLVVNQLTYKGRNIRSLYPTIWFETTPPTYLIPENQYKICMVYMKSTSLFPTIVNITQFSVNRHTVFAFNDLTKGGIARIKHFVCNNPTKRVFILKDKNSVRVLDKLAERILDHFGVSEQLVLHTSSLPKAPVAIRTAPKQPKIVNNERLFMHLPTKTPHRSYNGYSASWWSAMLIPDISADNYVYVLTKASEVVTKKYSSHVDLANDIKNSATRVKPVRRFVAEELELYKQLTKSSSYITIVGVPYQQCRAVYSLHNWTHFYDLLQQSKREFVTQHRAAYTAVIKQSAAVQFVNRSDVLLLLNFFPNNTELKNALDALDAVANNQQLIRLFELCQTGGNLVDVSKVVLSSIVTTLYNKYPMLNPNKTRTEILEYINNN